MIVYYTLKPEHIDLSRTRAEGVAGLKGFLEFAMRGKSALVQKSGNIIKNKDLFVVGLTKAIKELGLEADCNIGSSEFKMDIGIVDSENPGKYLLGILLDGENSKSIPTAKDRFVSIPGVLEGLGWKLMRIWVLEWVDEPNKVLDEIRLEVEKIKEERKKAEEARLAEEARQADANFEQATEVAEENQLEAEDGKVEDQKLEEEKLEEVSVDESITVNIDGLIFEKDDSAMQTAAVPYEHYQIEKTYDSEFFYAPEALSVIVALAKNILATEAPISRRALYRKLIGAFGIARLGSRLEAVLENAMLRVEKKETVENGVVFYWLLEQEPDNYEGYRVDNSTENVKRSMEDVASVEIINALMEVLDEQISLPKEDLIRETAKKFGYTRLGTIIDSSVSFSIEVAMSKNLIAVNEIGRYEEM